MWGVWNKEEEEEEEQQQQQQQQQEQEEEEVGDTRNRLMERNVQVLWQENYRKRTASVT